MERGGEARPFILICSSSPQLPWGRRPWNKDTEAQEAGLVQWNQHSSPLSHHLLLLPKSTGSVDGLTCLHLATRSPGQRGAQLICPRAPPRGAPGWATELDGLWSSATQSLSSGWELL